MSFSILRYILLENFILSLIIIKFRILFIEFNIKSIKAIKSNLCNSLLLKLSTNLAEYKGTSMLIIILIILSKITSIKKCFELLE